MTSLSRRTRLLAAPVALALAAGTLGALAAPASAAKSTFNQTGDIAVGTANLTATNSTPITIPIVGNATPYMSEITVTHSAVVTDLDVRLNDLSHAWPDDIEILLVGPGGQQVTLWSDAGSPTDIVNQNITFDDEAASLIPDEAAVTLNTYRPTNYGGGDTYDPPAPTPNGNTSLSVFDGTMAAGTWRLFVLDDESASGGDIGGGVTLIFDLVTEPSPSSIAVSGLPQISDVNVGIQGTTAVVADDLNLLLVGPGGQQSYLIGDAGGGTALANLSLTLDDEAAAPIPDSDPLVNGGTYQPFNQGDVETFPPPAPAAGPNSVLSVFDGLSPNGIWNLFAMDDTDSSLVSIGGWSLEFTWADTLNPTGTVNINGGAATATSKNVTLNLTATDPPPASGAKEMRFSNDGVTFSAYQPLAATASWALSGSDGTKTVYAQFRDGDGNVSAVASDAIKLDTLGPKAKKLTPKKNAKGVKTTSKIKIKASEALKSSTVTRKNVFLKEKGVSGKIKAKVKYNAAKKLIVLTPVDELKGGTTYKVTVKNVQDLIGHKWDEKPSKAGAQPLKYSFKTA